MGRPLAHLVKSRGDARADLARERRLGVAFEDVLVARCQVVDRPPEGDLPREQLVEGRAEAVDVHRSVDRGPAEQLGGQVVIREPEADRGPADVFVVESVVQRLCSAEPRHEHSPRPAAHELTRAHVAVHDPQRVELANQEGGPAEADQPLFHRPLAQVEVFAVGDVVHDHEQGVVHLAAVQRPHDPGGGAVELAPDLDRSGHARQELEVARARRGDLDRHRCVVLEVGALEDAVGAPAHQEALQAIPLGDYAPFAHADPLLGTSTLLVQPSTGGRS